MPTKAAMKAEQEDGPREFEYEGATYVIPKADDWDITAIEAYEEGKLITSVKAILGEKQWKAYKQSGQDGKRYAGEIKDFIEAMFEQYGASAGE